MRTLTLDNSVSKNIKKTITLLLLFFVASLLFSVEAQSPPTPQPVPESTYNTFCNTGYYTARRNNTISSYRKFLNKCTDKNTSWHQYATLHLKALLKKQKEPEPKPELKPTYVPELPRVGVLNQIPKTNIKTPKKEEVITSTKKTKAIIINTGSLGKISEVRKIILGKTFESKLDDYFAIVPKEIFEEAKEEAFQELEDEECTEDQCVMKIQEILQVENAFKMQLIMDGQDSQISITWNNQEEKRVEEDYCEGCKTKELRKIVSGLVEKLVGGDN